MRRFGLIHPLALAFYSRPLYRDVLLQWKGFGLTYLLVLLSLSTIPGVLRLSYAFSEAVSSDAPAVVRQIPAMTIKEGRLSVDAQQPYVITDKSGNNVLAIIDTTGSRKSLEGTDARVLFTERQVLIRQGTEPPRVWELSDFGDLVIDRRIVFDLLDDLDRIFPVMAYPLALCVALVFHAASACLLGSAAYAAARLRGAPAGLQAMIRLAAVAMTPSVIIGALLGAAGLRSPAWWPVGFVVSAGYVLYGMRSQESVHEGRQDTSNQ